MIENRPCEVAVVDDDPAVLEFFRFILELAGYEVRTYPSAMAYLAVKDHSPRCLILDQHMPMMTGLELARALRNNEMLFLAAEDPERDISLYLNSPGGSITAGLAILDTMRLVEPDIVTYCLGQCASMVAVLWPAAQKASGSACLTRVF